MLTNLYYINNQNERITFNEGPPNLKYPVMKWDTYPVLADEEIEKMEFPGEWPSYGYPKRRYFECGGDIVGNSTADYITKRLALLDVMMPKNRALTARRHGTLYIRYDGMTEDVWFYVRVIRCNTPMTNAYISVSEFDIMWKAFDPYGYGLSTGRTYNL